jgi:hypothetical protein
VSLCVERMKVNIVISSYVKLWADADLEWTTQECGPRDPRAHADEWMSASLVSLTGRAQ